MTLPSFISVSNSGEAVNRTSFSVTVPATELGDRMVCSVGHGTATDDGGDAPTNWAKLSGTAQGLSIYERVNCPVDAGGTVTFTQDSSNWWVAQVYLIRGSHLSEASQLSTRGAATSANPDCNSLTPTGGTRDWFWIASTFYGHALGTDQTTSAYPTDYTSTTDSDPGGGFGQVRIASAYRALNASVQDPAAFTITGSLSWVTFTIAVPPKFSLPIRTPRAQLRSQNRR
jgi:hypothetical protein